MAKLEKIVHTALDELRMQMLGTQVLIGFQLHGAFQLRFDALSSLAKKLDLAALSLLVLSLGLLLAAPSQHRLVERGRTSLRLLRAAGRFAEWARAPFALAIGFDVFVVAEPYGGRPAAGAAAAAATAMALVLWYGLGAGLREFLPRQETEHPVPTDGQTSLHEKIDQMLTEARVVLPGAQALMGFQFVVTLTKAFSELPASDRLVHFLALAALILAILLLLTPPAVHRLAFGGNDVPRFHQIGSALVTAALAPLAAGLAADFYVATVRMLGDRIFAAWSAGAMLLILAGLWYALPLAVRWGKV